MRIRRSLTSTTSSAVHTSSSDPDHNHNNILFPTPTRCNNNNNNIITNTKTSSSIIICVFNQSPWDVNDLSSLQLDGGGGGGLFSLTGIAPVPVPKLALGSQSFGFSVKLCVEETKQPPRSAAASDKCLNRRVNANSTTGSSPPGVKIMTVKNSTRGKIVSSNKPQIRASSVKKQQIESSDSALKTRRGRAVKKSSAANNPNEFYYYSGFGPHWGKKRETVIKSSSVVENKVVVSKQEMQVKNEEGTKRDIEFMDYDDDDDDIDGEENEGTRRRPQGRKRVKARSLKSLM